jgi:hypothetical protein
MANISSEVRRETLERDHYRCQECGKRVSLEARGYALHHLRYGENDDLPENLVTLCPSCHRWHHLKKDAPKRYLTWKNEYHAGQSAHDYCKTYRLTHGNPPKELVAALKKALESADNPAVVMMFYRVLQNACPDALGDFGE